MKAKSLTLPAPAYSSRTSVEEALLKRRSVREYSGEELALEEISQLLWSAYGVTSPEGYRTAPSAQTLYPLKLYLVSGQVTSLPPGIYAYDPTEHTIQLRTEGNRLLELYNTTFAQESVKEAAAVLAITAVYDKAREKFGEAGPNYVHMDLGHVGQNIHLQAVALSLGTVVIAAFRPDSAKTVLGLPEQETPLYLMPVGRPRR